MPTDDLVGCFYAGSSQADGPDFLAPRPTVRTWKKEGKGYFVSHGKFFQLVRAAVEAVKELLGHGNLVPFSRIQKRVGGSPSSPAAHQLPNPCRRRSSPALALRFYDAAGTMTRLEWFGVILALAAFAWFMFKVLPS